MQTRYDSENGIYQIKLGTNFDFESHQVFRQAIKEASGNKVKRIVIDFADVEYIDSSALGMLMLAKNETENLDCTIDLEHVHGYVQKVLGMVKFDKLFNIKPGKGN